MNCTGLKRLYLEGRWFSLPTFFRACECCRDIKLKWLTLTDQRSYQEDISNPIYREFMKDMMPYCIKVIEKPETWYGQNATDCKVYVFLYEKEVLSNLKKYTIDLLMQDCTIAGQSSIPQDLNLFRDDGWLFLGTVSHEYIADIFLRENETITNERLEDLFFDNIESKELILPEGFLPAPVLMSPTNILEYL